MLKKLETGAWIVSVLLFGGFAIGFVVPSLRSISFWAITPALLFAVGGYVLSRVNRIRGLVATAKAERAAYANVGMTHQHQPPAPPH